MFAGRLGSAGKAWPVEEMKNPVPHHHCPPDPGSMGIRKTAPLAEAYASDIVIMSARSVFSLSLRSGSAVPEALTQAASSRTAVSATDAGVLNARSVPMAHPQSPPQSPPRGQSGALAGIPGIASHRWREYAPSSRQSRWGLPESVGSAQLLLPPTPPGLPPAGPDHSNDSPGYSATVQGWPRRRPAACAPVRDSAPLLPPTPAGPPPAGPDHSNEPPGYSATAQGRVRRRPAACAPVRDS